MLWGNAAYFLVLKSISFVLLSHINIWFFLVCSVKCWSEKTLINWALIQYDRVLLVVASKAHDSYYGICSGRQLIIVHNLHWSCFNQRCLGVKQHVSQCVHSCSEISSIDSHSLFTHCRLICVSWRLIMIRKRNTACRYTQDHSWMYFTMSICLAVLSWVQAL